MLNVIILTILNHSEGIYINKMRSKVIIDIILLNEPLNVIFFEENSTSSPLTIFLA